MNTVKLTTAREVIINFCEDEFLSVLRFHILVDLIKIFCSFARTAFLLEVLNVFVHSFPS